MRAAAFIRYFDELDRALAPELVTRNVDDVEWHGDRPIGVQWGFGTRLVSVIGTVQREVNQGAFWIEGTASRAYRDYPVRFPLLTRTVRLKRDQNGNPLLINPGPWQPNGDSIEPDAASAWIENPHADRDLRALASAYINTLNPKVYRVTLRNEYGLWADHDTTSPSLFSTAAAAMRRGASPEARRRGASPEARRRGVAPAIGGDAFSAIYAPASEDDETSDPSDRETEPAVAPVPLNREQRFAVLQARHRLVTVISGPPGTGKTHALTAILFEQLAAGRTTLIVTATEPAREAIETMLAAYEALPVVRFGRDVSPMVLGNALAERASSLRVQGRHRDLVATLQRLDAERDDLFRRARLGLSRYLPSIGDDTGGATDEPPTRSGSWWRRLSPRAAPALDEDLDDEIDPLLERLAATDRNRRAVAADLLVARYLASVKPAQRRDLAALARALRLDPMERRDALGALDVDVIAAAPIWLGTLDAVDTFLPPVEALFDLVVFDEASQISQLDAVGALRRAHRTAVIGDPHQMRHRVRTSQAQREVAADIAELSDTDRAIVDEDHLSLYDVAASVAPVHRLVDHYRSSPHIIAFSNQHFYGNELRLMTRHPWRESRDSIHLVPARPSVGPLARSQIDAAMATIRRAHDHGYATVGLVVPDAENAAYALEAATRTLGPDHGSRPRLRVGEPHEFQGIELDVMVIVTGVGPDPGDPVTAHRLQTYEDPNTLNTVITRARYDVYVIVDQSVADLPAGLWRAYLESESKPPRPPVVQAHADAWKQLVATETAALGEVPVRIDYRVGPHVIDLVVGPGHLAFGVFTGVHSDGPDAHIERYLALDGIGWRLTHVLERDWLGREPDAVVEIVRRARRSAT